ncbi:type II toxin-antitoxin system RelE/ParE family toxin [Erythrobacter sp. SCSIO 43205]|uniref:type II toxin-antitoxin system RelE/ParE family toxin n=1 Tax=Erythrobacter sp. SCSIO 43205 TaxID=2779361 RepID=UPI001CA81783|nr:type II toxin-antitoxin system RelE/ParE family toxin [Erythrobacter sp. SCSIO 43205]UAB77465.1 type II toxin-antitoxin system RelE/ParE family toxin [Erythrobacter sp. SCSIO 43205]
MRKLLIGRQADNDLVSISQYTSAEFGESQARKYRDQLRGCFNALLSNPHLGRSAEELAPGLRRIRQQAHVVFYLPTDDEILIVRVLHHSMDFERHL